jgi:hypothetical protein
MGKIKIDNTNWQESNKNNTKHRGNGIGTQNSELMAVICELIKKFLEQKYDCFKNQLENESSRKPSPTSGPNDGSTSLGSRVGPGIIGDGGDGHVGDTNIYVGIPDPDAEELADIINNIRLEEERLYGISTSCS